MARVRTTSRVTRVRRYICLAEYKCGCRPAGIPVCRNTMLRHREIANARRLAKLMRALPWGPSHTEKRAAEVKQRYNELPSEDQTNFAGYSFSAEGPNPSSRIQLRDEDTRNFPDHPPQPSRDSAIANEDVELSGVSGSIGISSQSRDHGMDLDQPIVMETSVSNVVAMGEGNGEETIPRNDATQIHNSAESEQAGMVLGLHSAIGGVEALGRSGSDKSDGDSADQVDTVAQGFDITTATGLSARAYMKFKLWAVKAKPWVETCVDFSVTQALFDRILGIIKAPYRFLSVKRNFMKYTNFKTLKYITCLPHMLISRLKTDETSQSEDENAIRCDVCEAQGKQPEWSTFEYLPLTPRIVSWYADENSYKELTEYRSQKLSKRVENQATSEAAAADFCEDYFDGTWFKELCGRYGGYDGVKNDIFLSVSSDGFQTFANKTYDCWPIMALNFNLPPEKRFLIRNILPLGFVKGPHEPLCLDTFFTPLLEELRGINEGGGLEVMIPNGTTVRVRVHILWFSADKAARNKIAGLCGQNGKKPCEECEIVGIWCPASKHYYFPSKICTSAGESSRRQYRVMFNLESLPMRTRESVNAVWKELSSESRLSHTAKKKLSTETGIKPKTRLYDINDVTPFISFPHDSMHHIMNMSKDLLELLRGENRHLRSAQHRNPDEFVISSAQWNIIDREVSMIGKGTSLSAFGPAPRSTSHWRTYKASECREFFCNYALILFEGQLNRVYWKGLRNWCRIVDLCRRPCLTTADVNDLERSSKAFYRHIEKDYFQYDRKRVGIMKSTVHSLLHLSGQVRRYGPMTNYNQFWVERRVGVEKANLHGTYRAAESMTENAKLDETFKLFYGNHFAVPSHGVEGEEFDATVKPLPPIDPSSFRDPIHRYYNTRQLLHSYLIRKGISGANATELLRSNRISVYGRARVLCGSSAITVGAMKSRRHRKDMARADWYVSTEFESSGESNCRDVYYGRVLQVFTYSLEPATPVLLLIDWARNLRVNDVGEVFCDAAGSAFANPTVEDASIVINSIGIMEHRVDRGKRTYFMDPKRRANRLLEEGTPGTDGIVRRLKRRH